MCWCGSGVEQLIRNQWVGGSNPPTSSKKKAAISGVKNAVARFFIEGGIQIVSGMLTGAASYLVGAAIKGEEISFKNCMKAVLIGGLTSAIMFCGSKLLKAIGNKFSKNNTSKNEIPTESTTPRKDPGTQEDPLARARRIGREGEANAVEFGKGNERYKYTGSLSGKKRISDGVIYNGDKSVLQEVKNVKYQGYTKQMKDYVAELGKTIKQGDDTIIFRYLELFVRKNGGTKISSGLRELIEKGLIVLREVL